MTLDKIGTLCVCQNCTRVWAEDRLGEIEDYHQRVSPGELVPYGECPSCGSLCHALTTSDHPDPEAALLGDFALHAREIPLPEQGEWEELGEYLTEYLSERGSIGVRVREHNLAYAEEARQ